MLAQVALLVDFVQQTALAIPALDRVEVLHASLPRADVAHLDDDERVLVCGPSREEHVCVQLPRRALNAITEVLDQRGRGRPMEATANISNQYIAAVSGPEESGALDEISREYHRNGECARLVTRRYAEGGTCTTQGPPQI